MEPAKTMENRPASRTENRCICATPIGPGDEGDALAAAGSWPRLSCASAKSGLIGRSFVDALNRGFGMAGSRLARLTIASV